LKLRDPESMSEVIGNLLRIGVLLSAVIITVGTVLFLEQSGNASLGSSLNYSPGVPHDGLPVNLAGLASGLQEASPPSIIELGVIVLLATPVTRVIASVFLFAAERDRQYVYITAVVLGVLLFSIFVTPFIPLFNS
jgi:uncharacterized membrane protein